MPFAAEKATMPSRKRARRPAVELSQEEQKDRHIRRRLDATDAEAAAAVAAAAAIAAEERRQDRAAAV